MSEPVRQEEDRIRTGRIITIGVLALVAFGIGIAWAVQIQTAVVGGVKSPVVPKAVAVGQREVGMVYQPLFDSAEIAREHDAPRRARLQTYGWADEARKTVHIPIDRAIQLVVEKGQL
jgi:hypothetical protein